MPRSGTLAPRAKLLHRLAPGALGLLCTSCQLVFFNPAGEKTGPPQTKTVRREQSSTSSATHLAITAAAPAASGVRVRFEGSDLCEIEETVETRRETYPVDGQGLPVSVAPWLALDLVASGGLVVAGVVVDDAAGRAALLGSGAVLGAGSLALFAIREVTSRSLSIERRSSFIPCTAPRPFADRAVTLTQPTGRAALSLASGSDGSVEVPASLLGSLILLQPTGARRPWHLSFSALGAHATWTPTDAVLEELGPAWTCAAASDWPKTLTAPLDLPRFAEIAARLAAVEATCPTPAREGLAAWCEQLGSTQIPIDEGVWATAERASSRCEEQTRCDALGAFLAQGLPKKDLLVATRLIHRFRTACPAAAVAQLEAPLLHVSNSRSKNLLTFADAEEFLGQLLEAAEVLPREARDRLLSYGAGRDGVARGAMSRSATWEEARRRIESVERIAPSLPAHVGKSLARKVVTGILGSQLHLAVDEGQGATQPPRASDREAARAALAAAERVLGKGDPLAIEVAKQRSVFDARF